MLGDRRYKWTRGSFGLTQVKNEKDIFKFQFGYTDYHKKVLAASQNQIFVQTTSPITVTTYAVNVAPDVPRVLSLTMGGTAAGVLGGTATITGTNVEGKVITDTFAITGGSTGTVNGVLAFKNVTSIRIPAQLATSTFQVGVTNALGLYHRLEPNQWGMRVILDSGAAAGNVIPGIVKMRTHVFDTQPTVVTNSKNVEANTVTPATAPNGTNAIRVAYYTWLWSLDNEEGYEQYFTSTSTSSTSTSVSTSSTSTSISSTSSSISSTSSSISTSLSTTSQSSTSSSQSTSTSASTSVSSTSSSISSTSTSSTSTSTTTVP